MGLPNLDLDFRKNLIINANHAISQRWTSTTTTIAAAGFYLTDRHFYYCIGSNTKQFSLAQVSDAPAGLLSDSIKNAYRIQTTVVPTFGTGDFISPIGYKIEGYEYAYLHNGQKVAFSFYMKAPKAGLYTVLLQNEAANRRQRHGITIAAGEVGTWVRRTILFTTDTAGLWNLSNGAGFIMLVGGYTEDPAMLGGAATTWVNDAVTTIAGSVKWMDTVGAQLSFTGFEFYGYKGEYSEKPFTPRRQSWPEELELCQRYYEKSYPQFAYPGFADVSSTAWLATYANSSRLDVSVSYKVPKRQSPTVTLYDFAGNVNRIRANASDNQLITQFFVNSEKGFVASKTQAGLSEVIFHWVADAEL